MEISREDATQLVEQTMITILSLTYNVGTVPTTVIACYWKVASFKEIEIEIDKMVVVWMSIIIKEGGMKKIYDSVNI